MTGGAFAHPLDLIKVRMQLQGEGVAKATKVSHSPFSMASHIAKSEGITGLYKGLSASLFRQFVYSGSRFGIYAEMKHAYGESPEKPLPFAVKVPMALTSGAMGAFIGNPGDIAMVRMQADGKLEAAKRRNYKNIFDALLRISREEGVSTLWRGSGATVNRAMLVTVGHLAAYDQAKQTLLENQVLNEGIPLHFSASFYSYDLRPVS
jgi:solute carrier family 25 oxoglutarate transporter 11